MTTKIGGIVIDIDARLAKLEANLAKADNRFRRFDNDVRRHGRRLESTFKSIGAAAAAYLSFQALTSGSRAIVETTRKFRQFEQSLKIVTGSAEAAAREMSFIETVAQNVGFRVTDLAQSYSSLAAAAKGTNLEGQESRRIFEALVRASAAYGLSNEQLEGALNAVQQMISKGRVQAEELRGQLGERLPGAFQLAARAMGVTTAELNKMLERGEVAADVLLPRLARQLETEIPRGTEAAGAGFNRFLSAYDESLKTIGESGFFDSLADAAEEFGKALKTMSEDGTLTAFGESLGFIAEQAGSVVKQLAGTRRIFQDEGFLGVLMASREKLEGASTVQGREKQLMAEVDAAAANLARLEKIRGSGPLGAFRVGTLPASAEQELRKAQGALERFRASSDYKQFYGSLFPASGGGAAGAGGASGGGGGNGSPSGAAADPFAAILSQDTAARLDDYFASIDEGTARATEAIERMGRPLDDITSEIEGRSQAAFDEWANNIAEDMARAEAFASQFAATFQSAFEDAILRGDFDGALDGLLEDIGRLIIRLTVVEPLARSVANALSGTGGGFLGSVISGIGAAFGGPRAEGGPVQAGRTYLVGERGPEMFTPKVSGAITANDNIPGGGTVVVQVVGNEYFDARVAHVSGAVVAQAAPTLVAASRGSTMRGLTRPALPGGIR